VVPARPETGDRSRRDVVKGKASEVHPLMWLVSALFLVFFLQDWILAFGQPAPPPAA